MEGITMTETEAWAWVAGNRKLAAWAAARVGCLSGADHDDAASIAAIGMWHAAKRFDPKRGSLPFLAALAGRRWAARWKETDERWGFARAKARGAGGVARPGEVRDAPEAIGRCPVEHADEVERLRPAIARLPWHLRIVVRGRLAGLTHREVASHLGISEAAAKTRHETAVRRLRAELVGATT